MSVDVKKVQQIVQSGGRIWFDHSSSKEVSNQIIKKPVPNGMVDKYHLAHVEISGKDIKVAGTTDEKIANAVNVLYTSKQAAFADIAAPGYVYSDSFSGCVFYLFRGPLGYVHAVHAYRGDGTLADPSTYFNQRGGKLLYKWDSKGAMSDKELMSYQVGTVLACIDKVDIDVFVMTTKNRKILRLIEHKKIKNWQTYSG
jgi:hypothetical protein